MVVCQIKFTNWEEDPADMFIECNSLQVKVTRNAHMLLKMDNRTVMNQMGGLRLSNESTFGNDA